MTAIAHFIAITCLIGAAALAATPFARPVGAPLRIAAAAAVYVYLVERRELQSRRFGAIFRLTETNGGGRFR